MWLILQQEKPQDFVIATGRQHSVREFVNQTAEQLGLNIQWEGEGEDERAIDETGRHIVKVDKSYLRPAEVESLMGSAEKARKALGWRPTTSFEQLIAEMVEKDLSEANRDALFAKHGFPVSSYHE